jgi:hypothetical protein
VASKAGKRSKLAFIGIPDVGSLSTALKGGAIEFHLQVKRPDGVDMHQEGKRKRRY